MSISTRTAEEAREAGLGIAVMCAGIFCLVVDDAFAKRLTEDYAALQRAVGCVLARTIPPPDPTSARNGACPIPASGGARIIP